jgi:hypothetical protein
LYVFIKAKNIFSQCSELYSQFTENTVKQQGTNYITNITKIAINTPTPGATGKKFKVIASALIQE